MDGRTQGSLAVGLVSLGTLDQETRGRIDVLDMKQETTEDLVSGSGRAILI